MRQPANLSQAYSALGLKEGVALEEVKSAYKKLALQTHPDKNPGNEEATTRFQQLSEAYHVLVKHLDQSSRPASFRRHNFNPFSGRFDEDDEDDFDYEYDSDDFYEDSDGFYLDEDDLDFYMFLFSEMMRGRSNRYSDMRYRHGQRGCNHPHHRHYRSESPPETAAEYQARLRNMREEQEDAERRRAKEEAERKRTVEKERAQEKAAAEKRQKEKKSQKKSETEKSRKTAAATARTGQERAQSARSAVFAAARAGDDKKVKSGIWENNVDAAGGEAKAGCEEFVGSQQDPKETLLHIATKRGDAKLVEWLDTHNADMEERDSLGMTPFHTALQLGQISVIRYILDTYQVKDEESERVYSSPPSTSNIRLAVNSASPEAIKLVLEHKLSDEQEIESAWSRINSPEGTSFFTALTTKDKQRRIGEIMDLFRSHGYIIPHSPPVNNPEFHDQPSTLLPANAESPQSSFNEGFGREQMRNYHAPMSKTSHLHRGHPHGARGRGRGRGGYHQYNRQVPNDQPVRPPRDTQGDTNRGWRGRATYRGRGRGNSTPQAPP